MILLVLRLIFRFLGKHDNELILLLAECFYEPLSGNFRMQPRDELFDEMVILVHCLIGIVFGQK